MNKGLHNDNKIQHQRKNASKGVSAPSAAGPLGIPLIDMRPSAVVQQKIVNEMKATVPSIVQPTEPPVQLANRNRRRNANRNAAGAALAAGRAGGAARNVAFGANWARRNWRQHVANLGRQVVPGPPQRPGNGKTIFSLTNGEQIVIDQAGRYWRHFDGVANYYDAAGTAWPNIPANHPTTHFRI